MPGRIISLSSISRTGRIVLLESNSWSIDSGPLFLCTIITKEVILPGTIYIAPPDYHLLFEDENSFSLDASEKINHSRPSIDIAFESAAEVFGSSLIGILLSGANADGAEGLKKISQAGGYTIVQDPLTADVGFMPQQALNLMTPDAIVQGDEIGTFLQNIV